MERGRTSCNTHCPRVDAHIRKGLMALKAVDVRKRDTGVMELCLWWIEKLPVDMILYLGIRSIFSLRDFPVFKLNGTLLSSFFVLPIFSSIICREPLKTNRYLTSDFDCCYCARYSLGTAIIALNPCTVRGTIKVLPKHSLPVSCCGNDPGLESVFLSDL